MEIKLNAGDKIQVPANCKAIIENNQIIIEEQKEEQKEEFKDGDILCSAKTGAIVIFKSYQNNLKDCFCSHYNNWNDSNRFWNPLSFRHATEEEKQAFFDDLKAKGLRWNEETKQMEKIRKRAEKGEKYLFITGRGDIVEYTEDNDFDDNENYALGNYSLLSEREQAEEDAKAVKAIFEKRLKI